MGQEFSLHGAEAVPAGGAGANGDVIPELDLDNLDMNTLHGTLQGWNQELENLRETLEAWSVEFDEVRQTFELWSHQFDRLITTLGYERRNGLIIPSTTTPPNPNPNPAPGLIVQDNLINTPLNDDSESIWNSDSVEELVNQAFDHPGLTSLSDLGLNDMEDMLNSIAAETPSSLADLSLNETAQLENRPFDSSLPAQDPLQVIRQPGTPIAWPNAQDAPTVDPPNSVTEGDANTNQPEEETDSSLKRRAESDPASAASVGILIPVKKTAAPAPGNEEPAPEREAIAPEVEGTEGSEDDLVIVSSLDEVVNNIGTDPIPSAAPVVEQCTVK